MSKLLFDVLSDNPVLARDATAADDSSRYCSVCSDSPDNDPSDEESEGKQDDTVKKQNQHVFLCCSVGD